MLKGFLLVSCTLMLANASKESLDFLMIGDWGGVDFFPYHTPEQKAVAKSMAAWADTNQADFVLALGDNFYFEGISGDAHDDRFQKTWEDVYLKDQVSLQKPWYLLAGNHDWKGNVSAQLAFSNVNEYWNFPDYSYDFIKEWTEADGKTYTVQIIMVDTVVLSGSTNIYDHEHPLYFAQPTLLNSEAKLQSETTFDWIEKTMSESTADYLLVAGHYPVYSVCEHGSTDQLVQNLKPMLEKYGAHYLSGHDHCQEHISDNNVEYILSGNSDFCCYKATNIDKVPEDSLKFYVARGHNPTHSTAGFSSFNMNSQSLQVTMYDQQGKVLYELPAIPPRNREGRR